MFFILVLLVLSAAIVVFFSEEFAEFIKKLAKIPGVKLFVPLFIASWFVIYFEYWVGLMLFYVHRWIEFDIQLLMDILPFEWGARKTAQIINLSLMTVAPVILFDWFYKRKHHHRPFTYIRLLFIVLFIFFSLLMLVV